MNQTSLQNVYNFKVPRANRGVYRAPYKNELLETGVPVLKCNDNEPEFCSKLDIISPDSVKYINQVNFKMRTYFDGFTPDANTTVGGSPIETLTDLTEQECLDKCATTASCKGVVLDGPSYTLSGLNHTGIK